MRKKPGGSWWRIPVRVPKFTARFPKQELREDGAPASIFPSDPMNVGKRFSVEKMDISSNPCGEERWSGGNVVSEGSSTCVFGVPPGCPGLGVKPERRRRFLH